MNARFAQRNLGLESRAGPVSIVQERAGAATSGLPTSLLRQAARRLRAMTLVLITVLAVAWVGVNVIQGEFLHELRVAANWVPATVMILSSIVVFVLASGDRLAPSRVSHLGLVYMVLVSWVVPLSHYWQALTGLDPRFINFDVIGFSPVALWILGFTVMVPARPRDALIALILAGLSVPVTVGALIAVGDAPAIPAGDFAFVFVLPYLLIVVMAYLCAKVMHGLGREVRRA